ncbi:hypothetical protein ACSVDA_11970 [Cytobacillus sp. Hm23]
MSFNVSYVGGGVIDKVRELPYPHFSKNTTPYIRGRSIHVDPVQRVFTDSYSLPFKTEFLSISVACSCYNDSDYWELTINGTKICETIYTKELPESVSMGNSFGIVYPLEPNMEIKFDFHNISGVEKEVWYNIKFLR